MLKRRSDDSKMQIILEVILTELCLVSDMFQKSFKLEDQWNGVTSCEAYRDVLSVR